MRETFDEIANHLTDGYSVFHVITSKHTPDECIGWQTGIKEFAKWLDENGYLAITKEDIEEAQKISKLGTE